MSSELLNLLEADRQERVDQPPFGTPEYWAMRERDRERRVKAAQILAGGANFSAEEYYAAAQIFQHGDLPEEAYQAHRLALQAAEQGYRPARWLAAAAYDRWLMYQGKPQKYGTQYVSDGERDRLWDVDPATTDEERSEWDVPPLAEQLRKAEEVNQKRMRGKG